MIAANMDLKIGMEKPIEPAGYKSSQQRTFQKVGFFRN